MKDKIAKNFEYVLFYIIIGFALIFFKDSDKSEIYLFIGLIGISFIIRILCDIRNAINKK